MLTEGKLLTKRMASQLSIPFIYDSCFANLKTLKETAVIWQLLRHMTVFAGCGKKALFSVILKLTSSHGNTNSVRTIPFQNKPSGSFCWKNIILNKTYAQSSFLVLQKFPNHRIRTIAETSLHLLSTETTKIFSRLCFLLGHTIEIMTYQISYRALCEGEVTDSRLSSLKV